MYTEMGRQYRKGYRLEREFLRKVLPRLVPAPITVTRSAGSHTAFDVIAIGREAVWLFQIKANRKPDRQEREFLEGIAIAAQNFCQYPVRVVMVVKKDYERAWNLYVYEGGKWESQTIGGNL